MAKIIVAGPPVIGDLNPLLALADGLATRGHTITVVTGTVFRTKVEAAGHRFAAVAGLADYDMEVQARAPGRIRLAPGPEMTNYDWINGFVNPIPELHAVLQRLLQEDPDQYLLANMLWLGAFPVALGADGLRPRRWVSVTATGLALSSDDTTYFGPVPVRPGEDRVAANRAGNAAFAEAMRPTQERFAEVLRGLGAREEVPGFVDAVVTFPDQAAVLSVPGVEFERTDAPETIHLAGILPAAPATGWEPPRWWGDLDGSRPVVVVTQGTLANHDLRELVEPALQGLADLDVTVVVALGRDVSALSIPVPANARVAEYIPFGALLPKADAFVTNGGYGGTQQALAAGVPVVVGGLTEDKPAVAARVARHGLGVALPIDPAVGRPTPQMVASATRTVLTDRDLRDRVRAIAKVYADHDALTTIEELLLR